VCYRTDGFLPVIALLKRTVRAINGKLMRGGNRDRSARGNFLFCDEVARAIREEEKPTCEKEKKINRTVSALLFGAKLERVIFHISVKYLETLLFHAYNIFSLLKGGLFVMVVLRAIDVL